jgi:nicotinamide-nucleotide amidase
VASELTAELAELLDGRTVAAAESCTGGLIAQALAATKGSSEWFRGGVVSYQAEVKQELLGVRPGPLVTAAVAETMASGVARLMHADVAVSVTGAAGPDPLDGAAPGTVVVGVHVDGAATSFQHFFEGGPDDVCRHASDAAIANLVEALQRSRSPRAAGASD